MKKQNLIVLVATILSLGALSTQADSNDTDRRDSPSRDANTSTKTGQTLASDAQGPSRFNKAGTLLGMTVQNAKGEKLGYIKEIVIDLEGGKAPYAIMNCSAAAGVAEKLLAVPLTALHPGTKSAEGIDERSDYRSRSSMRDYLVLNAERSSVKQAQNLGDQWPSVQQPSFGAEPFWEKKSQPEAAAKATTTKQDEDRQRERDLNRERERELERQQQQNAKPAAPESSNP